VTPALFAIPGNLELPTGGYGYDRKLLALLGSAGVDVRHVTLPGAFPMPTAADLAATQRALQAAQAPGRAGPPAVLIIDGLAYGAMPATLIDAVPNPILALVHHPLCLEAGLAEARQAELRATETAALARAAHVVVTSPTTAATLAADFGVPPACITVAPPGTDPAPLATGTGAPLQMLAVGSVVARKDYTTLVRALAPLRRRDWRLTIVGPTDLDAAAHTALQAAIRETGLQDRIALTGPASAAEMARHYATADLMVSASLYEGYGMALAEALAHGLPIVCTTGGAAAATVPDAAAIKVAPADAPALTAALARVLGDADLRRSLRDAAWAAARTLTRWEDTARIVAGVVRAVARRREATS
jgi:glycosyltransferase involved in cell wall biosynthesis